MAIIGDRNYWSYPSGRFVRLHTDGCVVDSGTGLMGPCSHSNIEFALILIIAYTGSHQNQRSAALYKKNNLGRVNILPDTASDVPGVSSDSSDSPPDALAEHEDGADAGVDLSIVAAKKTPQNKQNS